MVSLPATAASASPSSAASASTAASTSPARRRAAVTARSAARRASLARLELLLGDRPPPLQLGQLGLDPVERGGAVPLGPVASVQLGLGPLLVGPGLRQLPVQCPALPGPLGPGGPLARPARRARPPVRSAVPASGRPAGRRVGAPGVSSALLVIAGDQPQLRPGHLAEPGVAGRPEQPPGPDLLGDLGVGERGVQRRLHLGQRQLAGRRRVRLGRGELADLGDQRADHRPALGGQLPQPAARAAPAGRRAARRRAAPGRRPAPGGGWRAGSPARRPPWAGAARPSAGRWPGRRPRRASATAASRAATNRSGGVR